MNTEINRNPSSTENNVPIRRQRSLKDHLLSNIPQKLIALVCSLILFVVVLSDHNRTMVVPKIPVDIQLPDGFVTIDNHQTTVDVTLHGRASLLNSIKRDDIGVITLPLPPRDGNIQVTLLPEMINLPDGVHIEKFEPEFVGINLEPLERRTVAVTTDHAFSGELLSGYQLGEVQIQPENVEISGPKSLISEIGQLYIEPIDLTGKGSTFSINRWIILNRVGLHAEPAQVLVTVNVVSKSRQHVVLGVPIVSLNLSSSHEFVPSTIDLTLVGDEEALSKIDSSKLFVTVDASQDEGKNSHTRLLSGNDFSVPNLPAGVGFDESKLPSVLLKVWEKPQDKPNDLVQNPGNNSAGVGDN